MSARDQSVEARVEQARELPIETGVPSTTRTDVSMLDAALAYANEGLPVFPCGLDKRPLTDHGLKDATRDKHQIEKWWTRYPQALIGVPMGPASDMWCVDLDVHGTTNGLIAWDKLVAERGGGQEILTLTHETPNQGLHLFFAWDPERPVTNRRGSMPAGIDIRGDGGYVIWPPSSLQDGRSWFIPDKCETNTPAMAPDWVYWMLEGPRDRTIEPPKSNGPIIAEAYARAALEAECTTVSNAMVGQRNETLNASAFSLGQLVGAHVLQEGDVRERLYGAAWACGLVTDSGSNAVRKTIDSGLRAGMKQPRDIPEREPERGMASGLPNGGEAEPAQEPLVSPLPSVSAANAPPTSHPLPKLIPIRFVKDEIIRPREWIVRNWIPTRKLTLLQGDGGLGKSPLMQQLQSSCATVFPWLGLRVEECTSIGVYTEDEEQDLKERQAAINEVYGCDCTETKKMYLFSRVGDENELVVFDRARKPVLTPFYRQVCEAALDLRARLVVLDVAVDLYGGNEIARQEVRAFLRPLGSLARQIDGGVVLTSHLSQAAIRSDGGHSGSTDWSNFVRARNYLTRPKDEDGNEIVDARLLSRKKATYASIGDTLKLHWEKGLILPDAVSSSHFRNPVEDVFLALLDAVTKEGQPVSAKLRAGNYAPTLFMKRRPKEREDYRRTDFERAMQNLFENRRIKMAPYGRPSANLERLVRADEGPAS